MKRLLIAIATGITIAVAALVGTSAATYNDIVVNNVDFNPNGMNEVNTDLYGSNAIPVVEGGTITLDITWIYNPNKNTNPQRIEAFIDNDITSVEAYGHVKFASYYNASYDSMADDTSNGNVTAVWTNQEIDSPVQNLVLRYLVALADIDYFQNTEDIHGLTLDDINRYNPLTLSAISAYVNGEIVDDTNTFQGTTRTDTFNTDNWNLGSGVLTIVVTSHFTEQGSFSDIETYNQGYNAGVTDGSTVGYANGYTNGYANGQTDPNGAQYRADLQAQYTQGYREGSQIANPMVYQQGYIDGQDDLKETLDMSNLSTEQSGIGAFLAPLNSAWVVAVDIYDWFVNHPIGSIVIALVAFVLTMALGFTIIKVIL